MAPAAPSPSPLDALSAYPTVDLTTHIGTQFPSADTQLSELLSAPNSDDLIRDLAHLIARRGVVFFTAQDLTVQQQKALALRLGELSGRPAESGLHKHPISEDTPELGADTSVISSAAGIARANVRKNVRASTGWHTDISFENVPADFSLLKMHTLPKVGGDTLWASAYEAYDRLSPAFRAFLGSLEAEHDGNFFHNVAKATGRPIQRARGHPTNDGEDLRARHPAVRTHPLTGWNALFVNKSFTTHFPDLSADESAALIDLLTRHVAENHDLQVRYRWGKNDVAIWDNRCTFHTATNDYDDSEGRCGNRVVGIGERPYLDREKGGSRRAALGLSPAN